MFKKTCIILLLISNGWLGAKPKIALIVSVYNEAITSQLMEAASQCLYKNGLEKEDISIAYVPGSFEIPYTAKLLAESKAFDAICCIGGIYTENNPQWTFVAEHVARSIGKISLDYDIPITWGIYIFASKEKALEEVAQFEKNRGWEAANAAIAMIKLTGKIKQFSQAIAA